jgi:hypothetical protein
MTTTPRKHTSITTEELNEMLVRSSHCTPLLQDSLDTAVPIAYENSGGIEFGGKAESCEGGEVSLAEDQSTEDVALEARKPKSSPQS